jgi:hypothetical protein
MVAHWERVWYDPVREVLHVEEIPDDRVYITSSTRIDERFGWCEEPELRRRGPTCELHHPVHSCDCGICNIAIKQRIALSEMKTYRCHKIVQACKIKSVKLWSDNDSIAITLDDDAKTTKVFERSHQMARAVAGDYYVIYEDGYTSRSPAKTFEAGYTEVVQTESGQYRKRPVVIDAWKIAYDAVTRPQWVRQAFQEQRIDWNARGESMHIATLEGLMEAPIGHWLIQGVKGELYACDPEIFAATYDPA